MSSGIDCDGLFWLDNNLKMNAGSKEDDDNEEEWRLPVGWRKEENSGLMKKILFFKRN